MIDGNLWARVHGGATHFPFALALASGVLDLAGSLLGERPQGRDFHAAGYWTLLLGAAGSVPAVISGLMMTKGSLLGHGALRMHHLFVWPAFALLIGLATWRLLAGQRVPVTHRFGYFAIMAGAALCLLAAGYWGGELMMTVPT